MRQEDRNGMNIAIEVTEGKIVRTIAEIHSTYIDSARILADVSLWVIWADLVVG
jgi:hypothetical protein